MVFSDMTFRHNRIWKSMKKTLEFPSVNHAILLPNFIHVLHKKSITELVFTRIFLNTRQTIMETSYYLLNKIFLPCQIECFLWDVLLCKLLKWAKSPKCIVLFQNQSVIFNLLHLHFANLFINGCPSYMRVSVVFVLCCITNTNICL